jgi:diguanylate cyclase (GGDEF)-like protein
MDWHRRRQLTTATFVSGLALLLVLTATAVLFGWRTEAMNRRLAEVHQTQQQANAILQAVVDAETGVRGFVITSNPDYLQPYYSGIDRVEDLLPAAGGNPVLTSARSAQGNKLIDLVAERETIMAQVVAAARAGGLDAARNAVTPGNGKRVMDEIRETLSDLNARLDQESASISAGAQRSAVLLSSLLVIALVMAIILSAAQYFLFQREIVRRGSVESDLQGKHKQIALLSQLADSLHSSNSRDESYEVIKAFAGDILGGTSGRLYVYNNSRDQLTLSAQWGLDCINPGILEHFTPDECWALRRGKISVTSASTGHIQCRHVQSSQAFSYLCMPITGRGMTSGLLYLQSADPSGERAFDHVMMQARSFADQLSLALVNIELRERLQNMAIKDPLTELYNRRFLDEALSRELLIAERKKAKICVAMVDIDHFKKFNDTYGHPVGDVILKQVARHVANAVRRSDIVCRYGGEEMLLVMPDCELDEGVKKANAIREGIKALVLRSDGVELPSVTVSIGVALYPDHAVDRIDLVSCADQALYKAKKSGRDRVVVAETTDRVVAAAS